jgi:DNA primase
MIKKIYNTDNKLRDLINKKLKITDVAKKYGLDTDKRGKTTCPFHNDEEPSLILNDKKNIFHCFGCGAKGDLITFIRKMEEMKSGDEKRC